MTIFGIDSSGRLRVDSWGKEYLIDLESMVQYGIIFDISYLDIYKKNGG